MFGAMLGEPGEGSMSVEIVSLEGDRLVGESDGVRSVCTR